VIGFVLLAVLVATVSFVLWRTWLARDRELRRAEAAEKHAAAVEQSTDGVTHDVNNLLTAVAFSLRDVSDLVIEDPEGAQEILNEALEPIRVAVELNRAMTADTGASNVECSVETLVRLQGILARGQTPVHLVIDGDLPRPSSSEAAARVVSNLFANAVREAREAGGPVRVELTPQALRITNRVRDAASLTDAIYDRGVSHADSTGTGLALARSLCEELGWTLEHETGPDEVTFIVRA